MFFAQSSGNDDNEVETDCQHFKWVCSVEDGNSCYYTMPGYSEKFPDMPQNSFEEKIVIASDPQGKKESYFSVLFKLQLITV